MKHIKYQVNFILPIHNMPPKPPQPTYFSKLLTTIHIKVVCFSSMYFFFCFVLTFILCISSHKSLRICASGLYYILYIPLTCSHTIIFICTFCCCFSRVSFFVVVFYFILLYHPSYTRALYFTL